ncbi:unnamed protein product [Penicillium salamii]|nr:unnamed protein product [Penicillium salamii]CAG8555100.1 unnamed protein product [Penicillium salamii]
MKAFLNKFLWRRPPLNYTTERAKNIPSELGIGNYPNDWSALHILSYIGITGNSKRLVDQGANINDQANQLGVSPLHCAAYQGNDEMVEFLLQNGAKVNEIAADGRTALHMATQNGHRGCIKLLFSGRANPQIVDQEGDSCLHIAVGTVTDESTVPLLVKHKVDVNFQNPKTGTTALHLAVEFRRPRIILFLLEKDAAINIANYDGLTALQLAANTDNCEAISLLLQRRALVEARSPAGPTALQYAAWKGYWVAFDLLIIGGANINVWNNQGETLLHEQSRYCTSLSVVSKLLEQGANIEARTSQGYTPLQCAALSGNKTIFNFLLDNGAKIDVETAKGENLLHITPPANQDCLDILKTTLNEGINASATSSQGWTPLHQTVHTGTGALDLTSDSTLEYIRLLLTHGASVNDSSASAVAETPLHLAAMAPNARSSLVEFLIRQGSNVQAVTGEEKTALHLAAESGRGPILRFLLEANGGLSFGLSTGNTAAVHAEKNETPVTALDLAKEDPSGSWSFDGSGRPSPKSQGSGRNSAMTIFEDIDSNVSESR